MEATAVKAAPARRRIRSIEVGFRVIRAMLAAQRPTPLRDIAAAAGMAPSKAHLYLASFVREGIAMQEPDTGHYGLGPFAASLGLSAIRQLSIVDEAGVYLRQLSDRTYCASYLSILGESGPAIVSKADGSRQGALSVQLGYVLPLTTSATGQVFLAFRPPDRRAQLLDREYATLARNDASYLPRAKLEATLAKAAKQGYATSAGQINANFVAAAAPVYDFKGDLAAALTVLGTDRYLSGRKLNDAVEGLLEAAAALSRAIGAPDKASSAPLKRTASAGTAAARPAKKRSRRT